MNLLAAVGFKYSRKNPKSIYLGRFKGVGDILLTSPTVVALRGKFPKARITFGCSKGIYYDIIANDPNIDNFDFPDKDFFYPRSKNFIKYILRGLLYFRTKFLLNLKYDMVVLFSVDRANLDCSKHVVDHFAGYAGVSLKQRQPIIYLNEEDVQQAKTLLEDAGVKEKEKFIVIAYETGVGGKKTDHRLWEHFPALIEKIHQRYKIKILVLLPNSSKNWLPGTIRIKDEPTIRAGAAIIKQCSLFIGVDCGQMHIASAFNIKIVSIHIGHPIELYGCLSPHAKFVNNEPFMFFGNNKEWEKKSISVERVMKEVDLSLEEL
jgi:ADP-heptose:LPS heptosyltransferase